MGTLGELGLDLALIPAGNSKLIGVTGSEEGTVLEGLILREATLEADAEVAIPFPASGSARGSLSGSKLSPSLRVVGGDVDVRVIAALGLAVVDDGPAGDGVGCWIWSDKD
jgi:hypothetical protein